jgi:hypothetical protein
MANLTAWDVGILAVAVYIAVISLVRLMRTRRDAVVAQLQAEVSEQQERQRLEKRREQQRAGRNAASARAGRNART